MRKLPYDEATELHKVSLFDKVKAKFVVKFSENGNNMLNEFSVFEEFVENGIAWRGGFN